MIYLTNPAPSRILECSETIRDLADSLLLRADSRFGVLAFYGDDSGNHGKGPFVLAGYMAQTSDWFELERFWVPALRESPSIEYFKMAECYRGKGQFDGWDLKDRLAKLQKLVQLVCRFTPRMAEISSVMWWDDYHSIIGTGPFRDVFHSPYFFCLHAIVFDTAKLMPPDATDVIHYVVDHQSNLMHDAALQYYRIRETAPQKFTRFMGGLSHEDDKKFVPLQVADLIAWHNRRDWAKPKEDGGFQRVELMQLRAHTQMATCAKWNSAKLAQCIVDIEDQLKAVEERRHKSIDGEDE